MNNFPETGTKLTASLWTKAFLGSLIILSILCSVQWAYAVAGIGDRVYESTLPNGMKVILLENHKAPVITFQVWYRVGSRNEEWGKTGLSHMLEHMMFKGTKKVGPEELSRIVQEYGGNDNAFTSNDFTAYFENISSENIHIPVELESDRMQNLLLRQEDFRTERMVVMEERRLRTEDNPVACLYEQMEAAAFQVQPYHWPTVGWMEDIARFSLEDLKAYYRTYYNPVNAFLVIVGDFKKEGLMPQIEKAFGPIPEGAAPGQKRDREPAQPGERRVFVKKEAHLPHITMGYHVPNLSEQDSYVLEVAAAVLSGGKSSRFYKRLVDEKRLVLDAEADNSLLSLDPYLFYVSASPLPGKDTSEVEKALDHEIELLRNEPVGERELEKAKNRLEAAFIYAQDSLFYQAMLLARYEIAKNWKAIDDYVPSVRKVTAEDIQRVAGRYLVPDNRTVGVLVPLPPKKGRPLMPSAREEMVR